MKKVCLVLTLFLLVLSMSVSVFAAGVSSVAVDSSAPTAASSRSAAPSIPETAEDAEALTALAHIVDSLYLGEDSEIRKAVSPGGAAEEYIVVPTGNPYTADLDEGSYMTPLYDTIIPVYRTSVYEIADSGKFAPQPRVVSDTLTTYNMLLVDSSNKTYATYYAEGGFYTDGTTFEHSGFGYETSALKTNDFRCHATEIYRLLKESALDLTAASAKYVSVVDFGAVYYLTDGKNEYVLTIGGLPDYTPLFEDFGVTAETVEYSQKYIGLFTAEKFIAAAVKQAAVMRGAETESSDEQTTGGNAGAVSAESAAGENKNGMPALGWYLIAAGGVVIIAVCAAVAAKARKNRA